MDLLLTRSGVAGLQKFLEAHPGVELNLSMWIEYIDAKDEFWAYKEVSVRKNGEQIEYVYHEALVTAPDLPLDSLVRALDEAMSEKE